MRTGRGKKEEGMFINWTKLGRQAVLMVYDVFAVLVASFLAILVRFEFRISSVPETYMKPISDFMPILIILTIALFYIFRLYSSLWAYAGENELQNLVVACVLDGVINGIGLQFFRVDLVSVPQSYYFLYTFLLISLTFISRFAYRFIRSKKHRNDNRNNSISVMIIGAGESGNILIKDIQTGNYSTRVVRCIIDDDPTKWGIALEALPSHVGVSASFSEIRIVYSKAIKESDDVVTNYSLVNHAHVITVMGNNAPCTIIELK